MGKSVPGNDDGAETRRPGNVWSRAISGRASARGVKSARGGKSARGRKSGGPPGQISVRSGGVPVRRGQMLGAPGRARSAHIVQFRPVRVECFGEELAPESKDFSERIGPVPAVRAGRKGFRGDHCHDVPAFFVRRLRSRGALFWALAGSFWRESLKEGFNCRYP